MPCPKLCDGKCLILSLPCTKAYTLKMGLKKCPVLSRKPKSKKSPKKKSSKKKKR